MSSSTDPREPLGRIVRDTWVAWAREQPNPKPSWLTGWEELDDGQREVDMRIGDAVARHAAGQCEHTYRVAGDRGAPHANVEQIPPAELAVLNPGLDERGLARLGAWEQLLTEDDLVTGFRDPDDGTEESP
jgi:hypothetical protein